MLVTGILWRRRPTQRVGHGGNRSDEADRGRVRRLAATPGPGRPVHGRSWAGHHRCPVSRPLDPGATRPVKFWPVGGAAGPPAADCHPTLRPAPPPGGDHPPAVTHLASVTPAG